MASASTNFPRLTDEVLEAARKTISTEEKERPACFSLMSPDVIRRWAYAIGDANPLWLDEEYARSTRWGSILTPPTFPETAVRGVSFNPLRVKRGSAAQTTGAMAAAKLPGDSRGGGFPAFAGLQAGRQFTFYAPVHVNEQLKGTQRVVAIVDSEGRLPGDCIEPELDVEAALAGAAQECAAPKTRMALQTFDIKAYSRVDGRLLMRCLHTMAQFARGIPMEESKYRDVPLHRYSDEEIAKIVEQHEREYLRGGEILYWEDAEVGTELPSIVKGPHTPNDYVMYHSAFGSFFDVTDRIKYLMLKQIPGTGIIDPATNVPDFSSTWHLGTFNASSVGYPRGFDGSMQRISWFGHLVTNWMGDDAFLKSLSVYHCRPLFLWDAMWLHGRVVRKDRAASTVDLELWGDNHRGERISNGKATVVLQNRFGRPFEYS